MKDDEHLREERIDGTVLFKGNFLEARRDTVRLLARPIGGCYCAGARWFPRFDGPRTGPTPRSTV